MEDNSLGVLNLILHAGPVVKLTMMVLFVASIGTWAIIFFKWRIFKNAKRQNREFLKGFWSGRSLGESFIRAEDFPLSPVAKSFMEVIRESRLNHTKNKVESLEVRTAIIMRTLQKSNTGELSSLEYALTWLATTASASPFIGLFGTVWGIMGSFQSIGISGSANLAVVAPGISEALVATALGLVAAVPAAIAYNYFNSKVKSQAIALDSFSRDLMNLLQRQEAI